MKGIHTWMRGVFHGKRIGINLQARQIVTFFAVILLLTFVIFIAGTQNNYFARLWTFWTSENPGSDDYFEYIAFKQRFAFADTAFRVYEDHPALGVGLGNYAFYFEENLPMQPWNRQPDILRQITHVEGRDKLVTPKNLFLKLLAETGLAGFLTFLIFISAIVGCAVYLWLSSNPEVKMFGMAGIMALIAFVFIGFSFDSFALPNMWVIFGMITAACWIERTSPQNKENTA